MSNILIAAKGSYGDLFPLYALAIQLRARGHTITFATQQRHESATRSLGLHAILLDKPGQGGRDGMFKQVPYHFSPESLRFETNVLLSAAATADIILGNQMAYFAAIVAKKLGKRYVYCPASPLALPSRHEPGLFPYLQRFQRLTIDYSPLQNLYLSLGREGSQLMMWAVANQRKGLDKTDQLHPQFEGMYSAELNLLLTTPLLVQPQSDWPAPTHITGFTWFEANFLNNDEKSARIARFLDAGSPPVVFALGGGVRDTPGSFFRICVEVCNLLGIRAIIVASAKFHSEIKNTDKVLVSNYVSYSNLFPRALAVVHSGGVGTIGWCLKYTIPSLLIPRYMDQFDNAYRASNKGFADVIFDTTYSASRIAVALSELLGNEKKRLSLRDASGMVAKEDGAQIACDNIEKLC